MSRLTCHLPPATFILGGVMPDTHTSETASASASSAFVCPQCSSAVKPEEVHCPVCKVDLALAAALAERQVLAIKAVPAGSFYVADIILPRFGEFLLQNGDITE